MTEVDKPQQEKAEVVEEPLPPLVSRPQRKYGVLIGGVGTLIAGILCEVNGIGALFRGAEVYVGADTGTFDISVCGFIVVFLGALAIAGGISALMKKSISLAIAGAAAGMMGGGDPGFWLGLVSLLLFAFSDSDF